MDDIQNLIDLYTQAVEFYNSTQQAERQKYYETKMQKLLESPSVKKVYGGNQEEYKRKESEYMLFASTDGDATEVDVKIYDKSATSPFNNELKQKKTMSEVLLESEKRKAKIVMEANIH